jgi:REP element-mobilizing transposase RayT
MPRQARIDSPGLLHHIISRGLERRKLFQTTLDYNDFVNRIESSLSKSPNQLLAWALMPNHFHMLIRSGSGGITQFMRRLMSGYAISFNARHKRVGYLFQNRYKSIICEEDAYLMELVRYIHLNPLRAGIVKDMKGLKKYPYSGHAVLMGRQIIHGRNRRRFWLCSVKRRKSQDNAMPGM